MCYMDQYKKQCPKTCGVCGGTTVADCVDHLVECPSYSTPCPANLIEKCPVTCGVCGNVTTTVSPVRTTVTPKTTVTLQTTKTTTTVTTTPCKDASPNCGAWAKNGFCTNTFYPPEKRKEYCAKTCKFC
ncbi:hypothetical protein CRE_24836 [Caenorhabditis remanei]|uniref:ShKT domain-containing protein n=1 Tax=Caenorhabditis remanei TaxID=31234 RepID=E3NJ23_CAERE|nr:hypothetical protein CRE_24836 [Caenorhabditis remanei]